MMDLRVKSVIAQLDLSDTCADILHFSNCYTYID